MGRLLLIVALAPGLGCCSGGDPRDFEQGHARPVVERRGDQIHPDLDGRWLVWFDLEDDPNGACNSVGYDSDQEYDYTCEGVVKSMDLLTGRVRTLSEVLLQETRPVMSDGLAVWRCWQQSAPGLCVTRADRQEVTFHPQGNSYYYYDQTSKPAVDRGVAAWIDYNYQGQTPVNLLRRLELRTGQEVSHIADNYPSELIVCGHRLTWVSALWEDEAYRYQLESIDTLTGNHQVLFDSDQAIVGLGGSGDLLAFKQDQGEAGVRVFYLDPDGQPRRADSDEARVSSMTPITVDEDLLVWLDHREGDYRVVAYDLRGGQEGFVSSDQAVVGAHLVPVADQNQVVWADRRNGDWDLYLRSF